MTDATHASDASDAYAALTQEERNLAVLGHVGPILLAMLSGGGLGWTVPLVIYLVKRDESPYVAEQAVESLNFHITLALGCMAAAIAMLTILLIPLAVLYFLCVGAVGLVLGILAGLAASRGERYRYPFTVRLIRA